MRWRIALLATGAAFAVVIVVAAALWVRNLPVASLTPTPSPVPQVATSMPDIEPPAAVAQPALRNVAQRVDIRLPAGWRPLDLDAVDLQRKLRSLRPPPSENTGLTALLISHAGEETLVATAGLVGEGDTSTPVATVTIAAITRNGLSLEQYTTAVERALLARGVPVHMAHLDGSLRADGLPVATIHYTLAGQGLDAYQVVAYDAPATNLIVFTFTTPTTHYLDLLASFHEVVHSTMF